MSIASDMLRGNTDMIILAHLTQRESYGYEINKLIQEKSENRFELKEATLYGAFRRLEEAGCVSFYWGDERTGARRRYYRITPEGREAFARYRREWAEAVALITKLIVQENGLKEER
ncbi:MAG: PadR family transcriptional regulator [Oscillospiraceae bacterium]|jgi:DNA-binding PadR family transcriptional regulator|nr:PadR family transcriptional regulator [Oscillospiraceae bacterium]